MPRTARIVSVTDRERGIRGDLRETRRELAMKDSALDAAEREITAIKTEIIRLAPLLQASRDPMNSVAQLSATGAPSEVVPLAPLAAPRQPALARSNDEGVMQRLDRNRCRRRSGSSSATTARR